MSSTANISYFKSHDEMFEHICNCGF